MVDDVRLETDKAPRSLGTRSDEGQTELEESPEMDADQHALAFELASHFAPAGATARGTGRTKDVPNIGNEPSD
jgi:hypothetical protein